jgi:FkbM family methyltransferase
LGCTHVSSYAPLFWRFPNDFLQLILLNALPHKLYADAKSVLDAEKMWADDESLQIYRANIRWRALGDGLDLPGRPAQNTYFPTDLFRLQKTDSLVDCGAFDGDTIRQAFEASPGGLASAHAIEADAISFAKLKDFVDQTDPHVCSHLLLYNCAIGAERGVVRFGSDGSVTAKIGDQGAEIELAPLDELFAQTEVSFIKMDIEGAEYDALVGASKTLQRDKPILAICVYHTQNDIWRIPLFVRSLLPDHLLFLRAYEGDGFQTVMYAVPPQRRVSIR